MQNVRGEAAQKDPRAVNRLIGLLESGLSPEEAAKKMEFEAEKAALEEVEGPDEERADRVHDEDRGGKIWARFA